MFGGLAGAETEARRRVEDQPDIQLVVGHHVAHVWLVVAGRHRPVDVTGIVASHVGPCLAPLGAVPGEQPGVVTGEKAVETPEHGET